MKIKKIILRVSRIHPDYDFRPKTTNFEVPNQKLKIHGIHPRYIGNDIRKVGVAVYVYFPWGYFQKDMCYETAKSSMVSKKRNEALD